MQYCNSLVECNAYGCIYEHILATRANLKVVLECIFMRVTYARQFGNAPWLVEWLLEKDLISYPSLRLDDLKRPPCPLMFESSCFDHVYVNVNGRGGCLWSLCQGALPTCLNSSPTGHVDFPTASAQCFLHLQ